MRGWLLFSPVVLIELFVLSHPAFTQNAFSDEDAVKSINEIIYSPEFIFENHTDYVLSQGDRAIRRAQETSNDTLMAKAMLVIGKVKILFSDYDSALYFISNGMGILSRVHDPFLEARLCLEAGKLFKLMRDYDQSMKYLIKSASLFSDLQLNDDLALANLAIAELYRKLAAYDKANEMLEEVCRYIEKEKPSDYVLAEYYNRIAAVHNEDRGSTSSDTSLYYTNLALQISERCKNKHLIAVALNELGFIQENRQLLKEAEENYSRAEQLWDEMKFYRYSVTVKINIARLMNKTGKYAESIRRTREIIALSEKNGWNDMLLMAYEELASGYELQGISDSALLYYKKYFRHKLEAIDEEKNKDIAGIEAGFQLEKKKQKILRLENEKKTWGRTVGLLSAMIFALAIGFIILFFYNRKMKNENTFLAGRKIELEQENRSLLHSSEENKILLRNTPRDK